MIVTFKYLISKQKHKKQLYSSLIVLNKIVKVYQNKEKILLTNLPLKGASKYLFFSILSLLNHLYFESVFPSNYNLFRPGQFYFRKPLNAKESSPCR